MPRDPRWYQLCFLFILLFVGVFLGRLEVTLAQTLCTFGFALLVQLVGILLYRLPVRSFLSAAISATSLVLLFRSSSLAFIAVCAMLSIASKFLIQSRGKHFFNPTNFGIVLLLLISDRVWVSPAQWGNDLLLAGWFGFLGFVVVNRARRLDISFAFLLVYAFLLFARVSYLGQPFEVWVHQLKSGSLLLFTFFMISDPRSTPDNRFGRLIFASFVAGGAFVLRFYFYKPEAIFYSLFLFSPLTPILDRLFPAPRYEFAIPIRGAKISWYSRWMVGGRSLSLLLFSLFLPSVGQAFCGFYVAKADASLYNRASQVVLVRDGDKTAMTMANDYKGALAEFAIVVPVPEVLTKEQIHVGDRGLLERVDAYSAPRLVEYFDSDPCAPEIYLMQGSANVRAMSAPMASAPGPRESLGVTIEASYTVGEYDILILGAKESKGLQKWLEQNGYKVPEKANAALEPYIKQNMKFFVAKVNLKEQGQTGFSYLRPIQIAYESPKFMLPIRLGMANSEGAQDLIVYAITKKGRVETTNYRTAKIASDVALPTIVKEKFKDFYRSMFEKTWEREDKKVVFLEYAWNMASCDPCAADPLTHDELRKLGVFWLNETPASPSGPTNRIFPPPGFGGQPVQAYMTRLHVRYDRAHFPEDLMFQQTASEEPFQGRYILNHPWRGEAKCDKAKAYFDGLKKRRNDEAEKLASLTGWKIDDIRKQIGEENPKPSGDQKKWYDKIFQ